MKINVNPNSLYAINQDGSNLDGLPETAYELHQLPDGQYRDVAVDTDSRVIYTRNPDAPPLDGVIRIGTYRNTICMDDLGDDIINYLNFLKLCLAA